MTIEEQIQALRDEIKAEREARKRDCADYEAGVAEMSRMLNGIQAALIGSVHSKERGIRETVNTHESRLDDQLGRLKKLEDEDHACTSFTVEDVKRLKELSADDVKKLKDMPAASDVKAGLSNLEKLMVYASLASGFVGLVIHLFKK